MAHPLKRLKRLLRRPFWSVLLLVLGLGGYVHFIEPNWFDIHTVTLELRNLAPEFTDYRIVQISDIHADRWMTPHRLQRVVNLVNQQQPDLVALTGDYITRSPAQYAPTLTALAGLTPHDRSVAVMGNHDAFTDQDYIQETLEQANVQVLLNQSLTLTRGNAQLSIAGVGDVWANQADLPQLLTTLPTAGPAILLAHEPDFADQTAATRRFDLQLSGHSHGGQVYLPGIKRVVPPLAHQYPSGLYTVNTMLQYTNRGVGMAPLHLRLNCRPEITVFHLKAMTPT